MDKRLPRDQLWQNSSSAFLVKQLRSSHVAGISFFNSDIYDVVKCHRELPPDGRSHHTPESISSPNIWITRVARSNPDSALSTSLPIWDNCPNMGAAVFSWNLLSNWLLIYASVCKINVCVGVPHPIHLRVQAIHLLINSASSLIFQTGPVQ